MNADATAFSAEDRALLRDALRDLLSRHWPAANAPAAATQAGPMRAIWRALADQGVLALGSGEAGAGWREVILAAEELGRAACPAPLLDAACCQWLASRSGDPRLAELAGRTATGDACPALCFGAEGGDVDAGLVHAASGRITGVRHFVEDSPATTEWLIVIAATGRADQGRLALVARDAAGISATAQPGLAAQPWRSLRFEQVDARLVELEAGHVAALARLARLGLLARALGAARRAFEMVVEHARTRRQFGQPIGRFQAIQHKLADGLIALEASALLLDDAAHRADRGDADWTTAADAATAFAVPALRQLELEVHHAFGAIGFSEEHEAPRHFRRVFADLARLGGGRAARDALAAALLEGGVALPDLDLGERANAFRAQVRAWLAANWDAAARARERARPFHQRGVDREFSAALGRQGWIAVSWPREYGGRGLGPLEQFVFMEEMALAGAPLGAHSCASEMIGPALIAFGSEAQKAEFLPRFLRGELTFSLGYSESEAGSDLASLRFRAERDGDQWVLNGEKLWTSRGDIAHYHWLAARTNTAATPPHAGISVFMVPLDAPGITIRTGMAMYGHSFSSVHYENVRIPDSARVGAVDGGWKVITQALANERIVMGSYVAAIRSLFDALVAHVASGTRGGRPLREDAVLRDRIGGLAAEIEAARQLAVNGVRIVARGGVPVHEAAMSKVYSGELLQRLTQAAIDLLGPVATLGEDAPLAILDGRIEQQLRRSIMMVVGGGTAEVQRNLIATRGLDLPR